MEEKRVNFYPGAITINNALRYNASIGGESWLLLHKAYWLLAATKRVSDTDAIV